MTDLLYRSQAEGQRLLYRHFDIDSEDRRQFVLDNPHLGLSVELVNINWRPEWSELLARLPNLRHVDQLELFCDQSSELLDEHFRPTLHSLVARYDAVAPTVDPFDYLDLRFLRRLDFHHKSRPATVAAVLRSHVISMLEQITRVSVGQSCAMRCAQAQDCPRPGSQHAAIDALCSIVQSYPDRYPALRTVKLDVLSARKPPISFSKRTSRNRVRHGAMAPRARALGLTLVEPAGRSWLEKYDAESSDRRSLKPCPALSHGRVRCRDGCAIDLPLSACPVSARKARPASA